MRRLAIPAIAVAVAAGLLALLAFGVAHQGTSTSIDASVARGDFPTVPHARTQLPILGSSRTESLADLRGKVVVLNVFASWCEPCKAEAPILEQAQRQIVKAQRRPCSASPTSTTRATPSSSSASTTSPIRSSAT